ncbi:hypothetical protein FACS1894184_14050 [Clostridia bacterium]|nr:hypothetical protein FACS1894184_14050 [Clostridia bacterium]
MAVFTPEQEARIVQIAEERFPIDAILKSMAEHIGNLFDSISVPHLQEIFRTVDVPCDGKQLKELQEYVQVLSDSLL